MQMTLLLYSCVNYYVDTNDNNNNNKKAGSSIKLTCYYTTISSVNSLRMNNHLKFQVM
jgi:hypothetical protein